MASPPISKVTLEELLKSADGACQAARELRATVLRLLEENRRAGRPDQTPQPAQKRPLRSGL